MCRIHLPKAYTLIFNFSVSLQPHCALHADARVRQAQSWAAKTSESDKARPDDARAFCYLFTAHGELRAVRKLGLNVLNHIIISAHPHHVVSS